MDEIEGLVKKLQIRMEYNFSIVYVGAPNGLKVQAWKIIKTLKNTKNEKFKIQRFEKKNCN